MVSPLIWQHLNSSPFGKSSTASNLTIAWKKVCKCASFSSLTAVVSSCHCCSSVCAGEQQMPNYPASLVPAQPVFFFFFFY